MKIVLERIELGSQTADFVTDAYATVGIAYHRAAGVYMADKKMQKLGLRLHGCAYGRFAQPQVTVKLFPLSAPQSVRSAAR